MKSIRLFVVSCLFLFPSLSEAQSVLTCELAKNFRKKHVFELKNEENNIVAKIYQQKRNYIIQEDDDQYLIQKKGRRQFVFCDSIFTDTIATISKKSISLKNIADYQIKTSRSGLKIREGEDLEIKVNYSPERKVYVISIHTPVYEENILNLLACYYSIWKCKEIIQQSKNYNHFVFFVGTRIIWWSI